jgi:hypothetical protein
MRGGWRLYPTDAQAIRVDQQEAARRGQLRREFGGPVARASTLCSVRARGK